MMAAVPRHTYGWACRMLAANFSELGHGGVGNRKCGRCTLYLEPGDEGNPCLELCICPTSAAEWSLRFTLCSHVLS